MVRVLETFFEKFTRLRWCTTQLNTSNTPMIYCIDDVVVDVDVFDLNFFHI